MAQHAKFSFLFHTTIYRNRYISDIYTNKYIYISNSLSLFSLSYCCGCGCGGGGCSSASCSLISRYSSKARRTKFPSRGRFSITTNGSVAGQRKKHGPNTYPPPPQSSIIKEELLFCLSFLKKKRPNRALVHGEGRGERGAQTMARLAVSILVLEACLERE